MTIQQKVDEWKELLRRINTLDEYDIVGREVNYSNLLRSIYEAISIIEQQQKEIERQKEWINKAKELFEDYHLTWCGAAECPECGIDDCALRELGLLVYESIPQEETK